MPEIRTKPDPNLKTMPGGIPFIIGNELAERFSFYGMKAILTVFMTKHLLDASGAPDVMSDEQAKGVYHLFTGTAYFFPIIGSVIADVFWGKYSTILYLSLLYCAGHGALAVMDAAPYLGMDQRVWLYIGMLLIAMGAGAIKPCVSAHVGDQFGSGNKGLIPKVFSWFYFSINVGAATSTILTPIFLDEFGPWLAFGVPGVLMALATFVFWLGRHRFIHVPPSGVKEFTEETFSEDGRRALLNLAPIFLIFIPMFWALFDQTGSAWVQQADGMDREFAGQVWLQSQIQALNPIFILLLIPVFAYGVYPFVDRIWKLTPLRKIGVGLFATAVAFAFSGWIETRVVEADAAGKEWAAEQGYSILAVEGEVEDPLVWAAENPGRFPVSSTTGRIRLDAIPRPSDVPEGKPGLHDFWGDVSPPKIGWQFLAYLLLTAAEVMVSITSLEFAYTQAPRRMKSFIMGVYFLGVSLGNFFTSGVNFLLDAFRDADGRSMLEGANYYWFFTALMAVTAVVFVFVARVYKGHTYIQGDDAIHEEALSEGPDAR